MERFHERPIAILRSIVAHNSISHTIFCFDIETLAERSLPRGINGA